MNSSELQAMKAELQRMQSRIDELEQSEHSTTVSRRHMLRGLGAAAAGAAVGGLAFAQPSHAATATLEIGNSVQGGTASTWLIADTGFTGQSILTVANDSKAVDTDAPTTSGFYSYVDADATNVGDQTVAVYGRAVTGTPASVNAIGAVLDGPTPLKLIDSSGAGEPTSSQGWPGSFRVANGDLWYCVSAANVGGNLVFGWRKLTGAAVAGSYHAVTPRRVYDSRPDHGGAGAIAAWTHRDVSVKDAIDLTSGAVTYADFVPPGATAIMANVTVTGTEAGGYLTCNPGGNYSVTSSTVNWSAPKQTLANGITLTLDANRRLALIVGGHAAKTQVIIDVLGYYL